MRAAALGLAAALSPALLLACGSERISTPLLPNKQPASEERGAARIVGIYRSVSGMAVFTLCEDGRRYAVSSRAKGPDLDAKYVELASTTGEAMLAILRGYLESGEESGAGDARPVLVVTRIEGLHPGLSCADAGAIETPADDAALDGATAP